MTPTVNAPQASAAAANGSGAPSRVSSRPSTGRTTRVLHLVSSGGLYGAEQVILNLSRSEHATSYVGALFNAHSPHLEVVDEAKKMGVATVVFESRGRVDLRTVLQIRRFLREHAIDVLHTHGYKSDIVGFMAVKGSKTRWIATNHVWHPMTGKLRLYEAADAFVLRRASRIVAVSSEIREDLIATHVEPGKIRVIDNGIDIERFSAPKPTAPLRAALGIRESDVVVTIVGRLSPEKGHKVFLEAAARVTSRKPQATFLVVGGGPMEQELRDEAARLKLANRVIFTGFRSDVPDIYALSDVMVNASTIEGLPMTILEAMASRLAVIATRAGGIPGVITDNQTGLLIDAEDVDALEAGIERLVDDHAMRHRLAAAAFEFVSAHHSFTTMCNAYGGVYREVMDLQ